MPEATERGGMVGEGERERIVVFLWDRQSKGRHKARDSSGDVFTRVGATTINHVVLLVGYLYKNMGYFE